MDGRAEGGAWPWVPARRVLRRLKRPVLGEADTVTAFRDGEVVLRSERRVEGFTESTLDVGYQGVEPGDLVIHSMDGFAGAIGISKSRGRMSPVVHIYAGDCDTDLGFVAYYLRHLATAGYIQALAKGIRERSTSFDPATLADLPLPRPPLDEQRRIAGFLDDRVGRIDAITQVRMKQLELLAEMEGSVRAEAIAGVQSVAPKRTLGNLSVTGYVSIGRGNVISRDDIASCPGDYPVYSSARDHDGAIGAYGKFMFDEELVTWSVDGGGHVFYRRKHKFSVTNIAAWCRVLRPKELSTHYLAIVLQDQHAKHHFDWQEKAHPGVVRDLYQVVLPDLEEQRKVIETVEGAREEIRRLGAVIRQQLDLLAEYKSALITAAVTGEIVVSTSEQGVPT
jgi:type I restriction enzyme S subunit